MARDRIIHVYALNVVATPHPAGIYPQLLSRAVGRIARAHGSDAAKITRPMELRGEPGFFAGRILIWTVIDVDGRWLDVESDDDLPPEIRKQINIPDRAKPNFRSFDYILDEKRHRIYFESLNDRGQTLGPHTALKVFTTLLSPSMRGWGKSLPADLDVNVTIVPRRGAARTILKMPGLRKLEIRVAIPNPDGTSEAARKRIYANLEANHAKVLEQTWTKKAGAAKLTPTPDVVELADVAEDSGFVRGSSRVGGKAHQLSTNSMPRKELVSHDSGANLLQRIRASIGALF